MRRFSAFVTKCSPLLGSMLLLAASGCFGGPNNYLRSEMANRGPVALSPSNPYLSSNLFIAKEIEHSKVLSGFIRFRGAPDAIEVKRRTMAPMRIFLFYLRDAEFYSLEESSEDWVIRGPEKIPAQLITSFANIPIGTVPPPLAVDNEVVRGTRGIQESEYPGNEPSRTPESDPLSRKPAAEERSEPPAAPRSAAARPAATKASSQKRIPSAREIAKPRAAETTRVAESEAPESAESASPDTGTGEVSFVEESSSGDIIHRVTFPGETLRIISGWYTGAPDNASRVARINGIQDPNVLNVGQNVRIPRYLLKRSDPMPLSALAPAH